MPASKLWQYCEKVAMTGRCGQVNMGCAEKETLTGPRDVQRRPDRPLAASQTPSLQHH